MQELSDYLDEAVDIELRRRIEAHISECPNCFVILDTTKKTIRVYKGIDPQPIPDEVHARLIRALERKMASKSSSASD